MADGFPARHYRPGLTVLGAGKSAAHEPDLVRAGHLAHPWDGHRAHLVLDKERAVAAAAEAEAQLADAAAARRKPDAAPSAV